MQSYAVGVFFLLSRQAATISADSKTTPCEECFTCPRGQFQCKHTTHCVEQRHMCNGIKNCDDGSDEENCYDENQDLFWNEMFRKRPDADREQETSDCTLDDIPKMCECRLKTKVYCKNAELVAVPENIPHGVTTLDLSENRIDVLRQEDLKDLDELTQLIFMNSNLQDIQPKAFYDCRSLKSVHLQGNKLSTFSGDLFQVNNSVQEINLAYNQLTALQSGYFQNLDSLNNLHLENNFISDLETGSLNSLPSLRTLVLTGNRLRILEQRYFANLTSLISLYLNENDIFVINKRSFYMLTSLKDLNLQRNQISQLERGAFDGLKSLTSIDLRFNQLHRAHPDTFVYLRNLEFIYFDHFYMCIYALHVRVCEPKGDGISSHKNLLEDGILRICIWLVALSACFGNLFVILGRCLVKQDNLIHSLFIKNLSLADMLMGIYLMTIGICDVKYKGEYLLHDEEWRESWECDACGVISTLSSEVSVLTLTLITFDRYVCIIYPLNLRRKNAYSAYAKLCVIWTVCFILSIMPVLKLPYFGTNFYKNNAVCLPLHIHDPGGQGWEYSAFLFLGINSVSFSFIIYAYVVMFVTIRRSNINLRASYSNQENCLAKRFFLIVFTDFLCWIPIICVKIIALAGIHISGDFYAWIAIFILPVNSALNPWLYTLTTKLFKQKVVTKVQTIVYRNRRSAFVNTPSGHKKDSDHAEVRRVLRNATQSDAQRPTGSDEYHPKAKQEQSHRLLLLEPCSNSDNLAPEWIRLNVDIRPVLDRSLPDMIPLLSCYRVRRVSSVETQKPQQIMSRSTSDSILFLHDQRHSNCKL